MTHEPNKGQVILIDDDSDLLQLLKFAFENEHYQVASLATGREALIYLSELDNIDSVRLLIVDRLLPDMDGIDIIKELKPEFKSKVPILVLSVLSAEKDVITGLKKGAVDYVTKPFSLPILMEKSKSLMLRQIS